MFTFSCFKSLMVQKEVVHFGYNLVEVQGGTKGPWSPSIHSLKGTKSFFIPCCDLFLMFGWSVSSTEY
jgi:hypothetical protein